MSATRTQGEPSDAPDPRTAEERAEEAMERVARDVSRFMIRWAGRAREELEDIVAEARTVRRRWDDGPRG